MTAMHRSNLGSRQICKYNTLPECGTGHTCPLVIPKLHVKSRPCQICNNLAVLKPAIAVYNLNLNRPTGTGK